MNATQQTGFLVMLKAVADPQRLTMIGLMHAQERTVTDLAETLQLSESTVSHHISKLHSAGFLNLRMAGTQRFYHVNDKTLARFKAYVNEMEQPIEPFADEVSDNAWIDALDWAEADKEVLRSHTFNGKLKRLPTKVKRWNVVLRWLATRFEAGRRYTEKEVNAILTEAHEDYATLRRSLVEFGYMHRERGGGDYWLAPSDEA